MRGRPGRRPAVDQLNAAVAPLSCGPACDAPRVTDEPPGDEAVPGVAPDPTAALPVLRTLEVDGERFDVRRDDGSTYYDWVSGPNAGYGFASSGPPDAAEADRAAVRQFLAMIDPETGYIAEDPEQPGRG